MVKVSVDNPKMVVNSLLYPKEYTIYCHMVSISPSTRNKTTTKKISKAWLDNKTGFETFMEDLGPMPYNCYSLGKINPNKGYNPKNCRWVDEWVQVGNRSSNPVNKYEKKEIGLPKLCTLLNIPVKKARRFIIKKGGDVNNLHLLNKSVLGIDPGTANFAITWIKNGRVRKSFYLKNAVKELKVGKSTDQIEAFMKEITGIIRKTKPDFIVAERFMARTFSTKTGELVSVMLGLIMGICSRDRINVQVLTASQWKISIKKVLDLKELYTRGKKLYRLQPHAIDAMCIGKFGSCFNKFVPSDKKWLTSNLKKL